MFPTNTRLRPGRWLLVTLVGLSAMAADWSDPYALSVTPREDVVQTDPETGAELRFLTGAGHRATNLYFHQRSWLADSRLILFVSSREPGGLAGYLVETGEIVRITAADGSSLSRATAAKQGHRLFAMAGDRVLELELSFAPGVKDAAGRTRVTARERCLSRIRGIDVYLNESCDGRYLAAGGGALEGGEPGLALIEVESGRWERLCDMPEGVVYRGHVQWSVTNPYWLSFAGEPNRLWVVDLRDRRPWCPYPQQKDELVTHESWWASDQLVFCGGVHPKPTEDSHVKVLDLRSGTVRIVGEGSWWPGASPVELAKRNWWHAAGSEDGRWIAADNWHGDIMLFEGRTSRPRLLTTGHRTYGKGEHPEVGWDRQTRQVVFASHKLGHLTVCVATIPPSWQSEIERLRAGLEAK